ncbi:hypothetical protein ACRRTK_003664 [Alexandromys fortis]
MDPPGGSDFHVHEYTLSSKAELAHSCDAPEAALLAPEGCASWPQLQQFRSRSAHPPRPHSAHLLRANPGSHCHWLACQSDSASGLVMFMNLMLPPHGFCCSFAHLTAVLHGELLHTVWVNTSPKGSPLRHRRLLVAWASL